MADVERFIVILFFFGAPSTRWDINIKPKYNTSLSGGISRKILQDTNPPDNQLLFAAPACYLRSRCLESTRS